MPFWRQGPDDILDAVRRYGELGPTAQQISHDGQAFAFRCAFCV